MKWKILASAVMAVMVTVWAAPASATPTYALNDYNKIFFANGELVIDGSTGAVKSPLLAAVGDIVYGVLRADTIQDSGGNPVWSADNVGAGPIDTLTGYFVHAIVATPVPGVFVAGPAPFDPWGILTPAELAGGGVMKLFIESGIDPPATAPTFGVSIAASIASMTDGGGHYATLTLAPTLNNPSPGYWYSVFGSTTAGNGFIGLNVMTNLTGMLFAVIDDPAEPPASIGPPTVKPVEFYTQTELILGSVDCGVWSGGICSNDPATIYVPEPGVLLLLGLGVFALGARGRRRSG